MRLPSVFRMHVSGARRLDRLDRRCYFFEMGSFLSRSSRGRSVFLSAYLACGAVMLSGCGGATFQGDDDDSGGEGASSGSGGSSASGGKGGSSGSSGSAGKSAGGTSG